MMAAVKFLGIACHACGRVREDSIRPPKIVEHCPMCDVVGDPNKDTIATTANSYRHHLDHNIYLHGCGPRGV